MNFKFLYIAAICLLFSCENNKSNNKLKQSQLPVSTKTFTDISGYKYLEGSIKKYKQEEIDNVFNAPDWFPDEHTEMPKIVSVGNGKDVQACALCHLPNGLGHPESANLAGLPSNYLVRQMQEYASKLRDEPSPMSKIAKAMTVEDIKLVADYFAKLKPVSSSKVIEADSVLQTAINPKSMMRLPINNAKNEPLKNRIIEYPENVERVLMRDPRIGFIAYVPKGSIEKGKELAVTGGNGITVSCIVCHGADFKGTAEVPRLAGLSPDYIFRQLQFYKSGKRKGIQATIMQPAVTNLSKDNMIALSAYLGSIKP